jgi:hypothetical protein
VIFRSAAHEESQIYPAPIKKNSAPAFPKTGTLYRSTMERAPIWDALAGILWPRWRKRRSSDCKVAPRARAKPIT